VAQVSSLIARVLQDRLARGLNDPRVQGMVSVLGVECTPDLVSAQVRISVLPADRAKLAISGIRSATRHLEGAIRKATRLRKVPRLHFLLDDSLKREAALEQSLRASLASLEPPPDGGEPADPHDDPDGREPNA
jgi:ribosome-binding factor A